MDTAEMYIAEPIRYEAPVEGAYTANQLHRWKWVRRLGRGVVALLVRAKVLVPALESRVEYKRVRIHHRVLHEKVWELRGDMLRRLGKPPSLILLGAIDYEEWIREVGHMVHMQDCVETQIRAVTQGMMVGIPVKIVPNMRGLVVMP